jgi:DNA-binding beta-propeller fold protein YncE
VPTANAGDAALKRVQTIQLNGPLGKRLDHMALDTKRDHLFVANMANRSLDVVDLKAGKLLRQIPDQEDIQGVAYAPVLDRVYVGVGSGSCNIFDAADLKPLKRVALPDADNVRYDPRHGVVYVAHAEAMLAILDAKTFAVKADLKLPGFTESVTLEGGRPRLYLNIPSSSKVLVLDTDKREIVKNYPLSQAKGNYPLAVDEANQRLFVGCRQPAAIVVLDSESGKEVARVAIPGDVDDLFHDARHHRLYAACGAGQLAVVRQVNADRYEVAKSVPTARLARTCLLDPEGGRLFVAVPGQPGGKGPQVWVYKLRP